MIKARAKKPQSNIPASGLYFGPTNSDASTNVDTMIPGMKKPIMNRVVMYTARFGENALMRPASTKMIWDGTRTFHLPYLKTRILKIYVGLMGIYFINSFNISLFSFLNALLCSGITELRLKENKTRLEQKVAEFHWYGALLCYHCFWHFITLYTFNFISCTEERALKVYF